VKKQVVLLIILSALAVGYIGNISPAQAGDLNCGEALICLLGCPANDTQCSYNCGQDLHATAENLFAALQSCLLPKCPGNPPDPVCVLQAGSGACLSEYNDCLSDAGCVPSCDGKACGDDNCGGSCGTCPGGLGCNESFECAPCEPVCNGKQCGDDNCGGSCGTCAGGEACIEFICVSCSPNCAGKECGEDGCGGFCGQCGFNEECINGICIGCTPNCGGKECGDNGCGGMCGTCPLGYKCETGICLEDIPCNPNCLNKECGDDGCEGLCGTCGESQYCSPAGLCAEGDAPEVTVQPEEEGDVFVPAGDTTSQPDTSGNGGLGPCPPGYTVYLGTCVPVDDGGGGGGGCQTGATTTPISVLLLLSLLVFGLRLRRRI
jgi:hypothetical protein